MSSSCCGGNCSCGSDCKCGSGGGCKMYPDTSSREKTTTETPVLGVASKESGRDGAETGSAAAGAANEGCKCNPCTCDPCNCK